MKRFLLTLMACAAVASSYALKYDVVVAQDGTGDFSTIQEAVNSVRAEMQERKTIFVKNGVYREKVVIPTNCINVTIVGESKDSTILSWGDHAKMPLPGTDKPMGTFKTYTLLVRGNGFKAKNITIENDAPQLGQAVALHVEADKVEFVNCRFLGNQDTIYAGKENCRQYFKDCEIEGTTDFIFGPSTAYFEACLIRCKKNSYITAPSTPEYCKYGFIFNKCRIVASDGIDKVFLGRPWRPYGQSVFIDCFLDKHIRPEGWNNWRNPENEKTARFIEIENNGPGASLESRVAWSKKGKKKEKKVYEISRVFSSSVEKWQPEE